MGLTDRVPPDDATLSAYVESVIAFEALPIAPDWRPAVIAHFKAITAAAALVLADPLDDLIEAAQIFQP